VGAEERMTLGGMGILVYAFLGTGEVALGLLLILVLGSVYFVSAVEVFALVGHNQATA
jgi:hypothetical protein